MADCVDWVEWMMKLGKTFGIALKVTILCDSEDVLQVLGAKYPKPREKADVFVVERIRRQMGIVHTRAVQSTVKEIARGTKGVSFVHLEGKYNPADALTKAADAASFKNLSKLLDERSCIAGPKKRREGKEENQN